MTQRDPSDQPSPLRDVYTVSRLNLEARALLEGNFPRVWVEGEMSNLARPRSGHIYFSLKDENCQVRCAMFRMQNRALDFTPEDGMQVLALARVSLYPERGDFQLLVQYLEEAGAGALRRAFDALKQRLAAEGLFDDRHKRPLPTLARCIGVVTSPTGAALRDILSILRRRFPAIPVIVYPVPVQGAEAAPAIARMLDIAAARDECDVLILARGGGSLEDLWAFNDEGVARAIHRCTIPVVAGIGHEVDVTIADFAADRRAATPSAAAELVTPDRRELAQALAGALQRLKRRTVRRVAEQRALASGLARRLQHPQRRLTDLAQRLDELSLRLARALRAGVASRRARLATAHARLGRGDPSALLATQRLTWRGLDQRLHQRMLQEIERRRTAVAALARALEAVGPAQVLERGYAIVTRADDGRVLRAAGDDDEGEDIVAAGALRPLADHRQRARWEVAGTDRGAPLLAGTRIPEGRPLLRRPTEGEDIVARLARGRVRATVVEREK